MSHSTARPIVVTAPSGETTYIPLNRHASRTNISTSVITGSPTGTIGSTLETILYDTATLAAANMQGRSADLVDPASADWDDALVADVTLAPFTSINSPMGALRAVIGGTGSLRIVIQQT